MGNSSKVEAHACSRLQRTHGHGMYRHRFETMWSAPRSSRKLTGGPSTDDASGERYRWALIKDFILSIANHTAAHVTPGDTTCVDESIVQWYGLG